MLSNLKILFCCCLAFIVFNEKLATILILIPLIVMYFSSLDAFKIFLLAYHYQKYEECLNVILLVFLLFWIWLSFMNLQVDLFQFWKFLRLFSSNILNHPFSSFLLGHQLYKVRQLDMDPENSDENFKLFSLFFSLLVLI